MVFPPRSSCSWLLRGDVSDCTAPAARRPNRVTCARVVSSSVSRVSSFRSLRFRVRTFHGHGFAMQRQRAIDGFVHDAHATCRSHVRKRTCDATHTWFCFATTSSSSSSSSSKENDANLRNQTKQGTRQRRKIERRKETRVGKKKRVVIHAWRWATCIVAHAADALAEDVLPSMWMTRCSRQCNTKRIRF